VRAFAAGRLWSFPINLATYEQLLGRRATSLEMQAALQEWRVPIEQPRTSEEAVLAQVGRPFYELFYRGYTRKHWGLDPAQLDASTCGRLPIRTNRDDRYLTQRFQAIPRDGYARLFERLLDHPRVEVRLGCELEQVRRCVRHRHLVYTGPLDAFFGQALGPLPYRSLYWEAESLDREWHQPVVQVNFPNDHDYTRVLELKHATGQRLPHTTILREFPAAAGPGREPLYPVPSVEGLALHAAYQGLAAATRDATFLGRLAEFKHLDMDQVVARALQAAERLGERLGGAREGRPLELRPGQATPLVRKRDPRAPRPRVELELVVARHREPVEWLRHVPEAIRVTVYDKGGDLDPARLPWARVETLPNLGREAHTYLHHLVTRRGRLAPVTVFCQGRPFDHCPDLHRTLRALVAGERRVEGFLWLGSAEDVDDPRGRRLFTRWSKNHDGRELALDRFHLELFGRPAPAEVRFRLGGQFALTAEAAARVDCDFYEKALELSLSFPDAAHCYERLWGPVFVRQP
jgi:UDP-galactopyranose mutase